MGSPMETRSSDNLSNWIDILAGPSSTMDVGEPQPYAVGVLTACNTTEFNPPMESIASSPECAVRTYPAVVEPPWEQGGYDYACPTFPKDELDELLEELAQDTTCPYLQQLTVPNLMATFLPQPPSCASSTDEERHAARRQQQDQQQHQYQREQQPQQQQRGASLLMPGGEAIALEPLFAPLHPQATPAATAAAATQPGDAPAQAQARFASMFLSVDGSDAPLPGVATAAAPLAEGQQAGAGHACSQLVAVLAALDGSGSAGEWGDGGDSQLCPQTASLLRGAACRAASGTNPMAETDDNMCCGGGGRAGFVVGGGCLPARALSHSDVHRCVERGVGAPPGICIDTEDLMDQPPVRVDVRELWLSKSLRRLRSIVRRRASGGNLARPLTATSGLTDGAAASVRVSGGASAPGAAEAVPPSDLHDAAAGSDQHCCPRGDGAADAAGELGTETRTSRVRLLAARLRELPRRSK